MLLQIPGAVELVVVLLIAVLVFGIPLLLITVVGLLYFRAEGDDEDVSERVAQLEDEIAQLRAEVGDETPTAEAGDANETAAADDGRDGTGTGAATAGEDGGRDDTGGQAGTDR